MSAVIFPINSHRGTRIAVGHRFPTDAQLVSFGSDQWPTFMAEYRAEGGGRLSIVAPMDGRIRFIERSLMGIPYFLLEFRPNRPLEFQSISGWASPVPRSLVFSISVLSEEANRLRIYTDAIREFRRRGGHRILRARFERGSLRRVDPLDLSSGDYELLARNALTGNYDLEVRKNQEILNTDTNISLGMIHYEGENPVAEGIHWYWMDVHEYFLRLKAAFPEDSQIRFPFNETPATTPFRIRYEHSGEPEMTGNNRMENMRGGLQQVSIFYPPLETINRGSSFPEREKAIPAQLILLSPSDSIDVRFSNSAVSYRYNLFTNERSERRIRQSDVFSGRDITIRFSSIGHTWPDGRFAPYNLALVADNGVGCSLAVTRDLLALVHDLTNELFDQKARYAQFIRQAGNPEKIKILENIERIRHAFPASSRSDLDDALNQTEYTAFSATYLGIVQAKARAARNLIQALNPAFFTQLKADPTDDNIEIYNEALEVMANEEEGDAFLQTMSKGFMVQNSFQTPSDLPLDFDWAKGIWATQRRFRGPLVKFLFTMVRQDMFHHIRVAMIQHTGQEAQQRFLDQIKASFTRRFGELFLVEGTIQATTVSRGRSILTGQPLAMAETVDLITIQVDSNAIRDLDSTRSSGMSGTTTVADALGHGINILNLLGTMWRLGEDMVRIFGNRSQRPAYQDIYDLTKDFVSLAGDVFHLMPLKHYGGISRSSLYSNFFRGFNVVFGAVSLGSMIREANQLHASGQYNSAGAMGIAAAGGAISMGAEALVFMGVGSATSGPMAVIIITGALITIWASLIAESLRDPQIVVDFRHLIFGRDYRRLVAEFEALPPADRADYIQSYLANNHNGWVNDLPEQVAHLNNYLWSLNATLRSREITVSGGSTRIKEITVHLMGARAKAFSRVSLKLFAPGVVDFGAYVTFVIRPEAIRDGGWFPASIVVGSRSDFQYQASSGARDTVTLLIRTQAPLTSPFANINQGIVAVTFEPSLEYILDPDSRDFQGRHFNLTAEQVRRMRREPFDLALHERHMENNANKSQGFITLS